MRAVNGIKQCTKCGEEKPVSEFHNSKNYVDGLNPHCKECRREYHLLNKERENARNKKWKADNKDEYRKRKKIYDRKYYEKTKESRSGIRHQYYSKNKERIKERFKERLVYDKEHHLELKRACNSRRYKNDIQYKLGILLRGRLRSVLNGGIKSGSSVRDLGCTIEELKEHIESLFTDGMSWDNHGKYGWHIDHILPLSSFDLTDREQLLIAVNYKNLQPLWAKDNLSKGAKIEIHKKIS